jgi:hypothetical protein
MTTTTSTLLREVIDIPSSVSANDYVLKLTDGVRHADQTLRDYVVTPQLAESFDKALELVRGALAKARSDGAFLHGSFGSGKSHFMAVLHQILDHNPAALSLPGLEAVVAEHDGWLRERRILRLTYHLIGAESLESALLGGYADQIRRLHPGAPLPELHLTDALLTDADHLRANMGDEAFFGKLGPAEAGWGSLGVGWDAGRYEAARRAPLGDEQRGALVTALTDTYFGSFTRSAGYVDLDHGFAAISAHAQGLGYDAVVLFLDELVLWLASRIADQAFVANEGAKVAKLVEAADARRAVPLVSFIARQRDLKDFLGEHVPGSEKLAFSETFRWWEDRFNRITLEDRNLPVIVERRLLRPRPGGAEVLRQAFDGVTREPRIWNVLLEGLDADRRGGADAEAFRRTYPFSPALVSTLVALSGLLQRERTALKVMQQLLVDGRDELTVKDLIPVGDVFDQLVDTGDVALTDEIRQHFTNARVLYREKLLPRLLDRHGLTGEQADALPRTHPFVTDARLVKTLLLSALTPNVPALRNLTAGRLAALNHGTIATPLPGTESTRVVELMRALAGDVGEVRLSDDPKNPLLTVELARVDYESIVERVRNVDNTGERRRLLRDLVFTSLGIDKGDTLAGEVRHQVLWRGSRRTVDVVFANVRDRHELPDSSLQAVDNRWKVVIDFPFDADQRSPADDHARIEDLLAAGVQTRTVCWIPAFLTEARMRDLGDLVCLSYLLASTDRFEQSSSHLSVQDRAQAKVILTNRQASLSNRLGEVVQQAYGAARPQAADIDLSYGDPRYLATLDPTFTPGAPVGARLADAFDHLLDQMLTHAYPAHPPFETEVRRADVNRVLEYVQRAVAEGGRVPVEPASRAVLRRVCNPLKLGEMLENAYLFSPDTCWWRNHFVQRAANEDLGDTLPVYRLFAWTDEPQRRGLDPLVRDLVVAAYALLTDRAWYRHDAPVPMPALEQISGEHELRQPRLPPVPDWQRAVDRAARLLGVSASTFRSAANLGHLAQRARAKAAGWARPARDLVGALEAHASELGIDPEAPATRLAVARATATLVERLSRETDDVALAETLARAELGVADEVAARSLSSAAEVAHALAGTQWALLQRLTAITDERAAAARAVLSELHEAARYAEHAKPVSPVLRTAVSSAAEILAQATTAPPPPPASPAEGGQRVAGVAELDAVLDELRAFAARQDPYSRIRVTWSREP